ncbi:hypothetical protein CerSpe_234000 [Prunus speciosa]
MFDGVPAEQLHQFIAASRTSLPLPLPLSSFPAALHASSSPPPNINTFSAAAAAAPFDPNYNNNPSHHHLHHHHQLLLQPHPQSQPHQHQLLNNSGVQLHRQSATPKNQEETKESNLVSINNNLEIERERSSSISQVPISDPWSNDELLALLRIRSTMDNWFPEFTWEHVSRKLAELGFKRSAEKCKEKFEEESRYFNNINFTKNYRFLSDLEELCHGGDDQNPDQAAAGAENKNQQKVEKPSNNEGDEDNRCQILDEDSTRNETVVGSKEFDDQDKEKEVVERTKCNVVRKRKRQRRFEMLKGFCEDIVNRMMAQQEEMHSKLLEDMVKRSEEKLAREEAWKKQEMDRMNKELEIMAHEQAISGDRQATIIKFLKKFVSSSSSSTSSEPSPDHDHHTNSSSLINQARNPNHLTCRQEKEPASSTIIQKCGTSSHTPNNPSTPTSLTETLAPQSPSSSTLAPTPTIPKVPIPPENPSSDNLNTQNPTSNDDKQDLGKRWPRDEVLALINLRCSLFNNGSADQDKDGVVKAPLWERISQGMLEKGYKRSAKRCKEKWENINKYFRKTKDVNKKRSLDSRTCPYFHQLSTLYNQGILVPPSDHIQGPDHQTLSASPENQSLASPVVPQTGLDSSDQGRSSGDDDLSKHNIIAEGEKNNMVQPVPAAAFDFEF